jgi:Ni,Fe-hydrogenase I cytochrome b subunit
LTKQIAGVAGLTTGSAASAEAVVAALLAPVRLFPRFAAVAFAGNFATPTTGLFVGAPFAAGSTGFEATSFVSSDNMRLQICIASRKE